MNRKQVANSMLGAVIGAGLFACGHSRAQTPINATCEGEAAQSPLSRPASVVTVGVSLFDTERVRVALLPYQNATVRKGLCNAVEAIRVLYREEGFVGIHVYVNNWDVGPDGTATIFVIEGRIARIDVSGASQFSGENVKAGAPALRTSEPVYMQRLDRQLRMINENPAKSVRVLLEGGQVAGELDARLEVVEQPVVRTTLSLDNSGTRNSGKYRATLGVRHANVNDLDGVASGHVSTSPEKPERVLSVGGGYRVPDYRHSLMWEVFAAYSDVQGASTTTEAGAVTFSGSGRLAGLRATRFLSRLQDLDQRVGLVGEYRAYINQCEVAGLPPGACGPGGVSVATTLMTLEYSLSRTIRQPIFLQLAFVRNIGGGGSLGDESQFELARPGAKPGYNIVRASGALSASLPDNWEVHLRASWQGTRKPLISGEQFGIGGAGSVRGYEERELAGDRGAFASLQIQAPTFYGSPFSGSRTYVFADAARVSNADGLACNGANWRCPMAAVGFGGRLKAGELLIQVDVGRVLRDATRSAAGDTKAHVSVRYSL